MSRPAPKPRRFVRMATAAAARGRRPRIHLGREELGPGGGRIYPRSALCGSTPDYGFAGPAGGLGDCPRCLANLRPGDLVDGQEVDDHG